jgi:DNA-binding NarL/FixJ family response regulator
VNVAASGLAVELAIEDRQLAARIAAVLRDLGVVVIEPGRGAASIAITDVLPNTGTDQPVILLADAIDAARALRAGVSGVLPKSAGITELRIALEAAAQGLAIAPLRMLEDARREDPAEDLEERPAADAFAFTPRELEVLALLSEGATNKAIARKLDISVHTAKFHVASILEKLDATGRTDAVAHAVRLGLLML